MEVSGGWDSGAVIVQTKARDCKPMRACSFSKIICGGFVNNCCEDCVQELQLYSTPLSRSFVLSILPFEQQRELNFTQNSIDNTPHLICTTFLCLKVFKRMINLYQKYVQNCYVPITQSHASCTGGVSSPRYRTLAFPVLSVCMWLQPHVPRTPTSCNCGQKQETTEFLKVCDSVLQYKGNEGQGWGCGI